MSPTSLPESFNTQAENPYVAAKREWNERYGSYIHQARMWQIMDRGKDSIQNFTQTAR
jgi:type IV secretory pathway TrbF-like protein